MLDKIDFTSCKINKVIVYIKMKFHNIKPIFHNIFIYLEHPLYIIIIRAIKVDIYLGFSKYTQICKHINSEHIIDHIDTFCKNTVYICYSDYLIQYIKGNLILTFHVIK